MMAVVEAELRTRWAQVVGTSAAADQVVDELLARHREPHRHYHGLGHVLRVLRSVDELLAAESRPVADADAVRLAAWFHDAVYDPRRHDNEAVSAELAARTLAELGQPDARVAAVARLVLTTAAHAPASEDEAVLIDADLAVLGADPATYSTYVRGVRKEYAHIDDAAWRQGRAEVLRSFLDRPQVFHTATMRASEARARANLVAELADLERGGATSLGAVPDAPDTVTEAVAALRALGYDADVEIDDGVVRCCVCAAAHPFDRLVADHVFRFEGPSDPGDEAIVIGVTCPACGAKSVLVSAYGPDADPEQLMGVRMIADRYAN